MERDYPVARLRDEMDRLFDRYFNWPAFGEDRWGARRWGLDYDDNENEYVVRAEAPGFEPDEFDVQLLGDQLTIRAEHKEEQKEKDRTGYRYGTFQRSVTLPHGVEAERIEAHYRNGVLEVHVPKSAEAQPKRISVKS